jgi:hypothetical protein
MNPASASAALLTAGRAAGGFRPGGFVRLEVAATAR